MDQQIQKLDDLVKKYLYWSKTDLEKVWGKPSKYSDTEISFYNECRWVIFRVETIFTFEDDIVIDIVITEYFLWKEIRNIFYYEGQTPSYKMTKLY